MRILPELRRAGKRLWHAEPLARDGVWIAGFGLLLRLGVVGFLHEHFPPADDGRFYDIVARRIAQGQGYTWLWPDGAVTYAAHYPVGYPALVGGLYAVLGSQPWVAMLFNAVVGALGVWAVHRVASTVGRRGPAAGAALIAGLHPGFVLYTPALMTEGVTAAMLAVLAALAVLARGQTGLGRSWGLAGLGLLSGMVALIRPQFLVLGPLFGFFAGGPSLKGRIFAAALAGSLATLCCLPWTLRNCARLDQCAFVSANGGWNLWIGAAPGATGRWVSVDVLGVPESCREVFGEAEKDRCFGQSALQTIGDDPLRFLALVPRKLAATFDWFGAPGHYLNASNPTKFGPEAKVTLGIAASAVERLVLLVGLWGIGRAPGPRRPVRSLLAVLGIACLFQEHAFPAYLLAVLGAALGGTRLLDERPGLALGGSVVAATAITHSVFFGDARYGMIAGPVLLVLAAEAFHPENHRIFGWMRPVRQTVARFGAREAGPDPRP